MIPNRLMQKLSLPQHHKDGTGGSKTVPLTGIASQRVSCKTCIPGDKTSPTQAPTDMFVLVLDGQIDISLGGTPLGGETIRFVAGDYIVIPANMTHSLACMETARLLIFE